MPNSESKAVKDFIEITKVDTKPKQAWTDIARFSEASIPAINFGPGDPLLAHTANEFVNKNEILESYKLLLLYLKDYR